MASPFRGREPSQNDLLAYLKTDGNPNKTNDSIKQNVIVKKP